MKTLSHKLLILFFAAIAIGTVTAQVPRYFKYQAVIRDAGGTPVTNTTVSLRISIMQDNPAGSLVYQETHVTQTGALGMVTAGIGKGTILVGDLNNLDWNKGKYFLKIEVDPTGGNDWQDMGTSELAAVPYSLYAKSSNPVVRTPAGHNADSALFEVRDRNDSIVFAVYEDGVRIYVNNDAAKGGKGGFAVGGRSSGKGPRENLLWITADSVRIYIDTPKDIKGGRGGFAVGGRQTGKGQVESFTTLTPSNYFIGHQSGADLTTGTYNSTLGYQSGRYITSGGSNAFLGYQSGYNNREGSGNLFLGYQTGFLNENGNYNSFLGYLAGHSNTTGVFNTFLGSFSGYNTTEGYNNTFVGDSTGYNNINGYYNTFVGTGCGNKNDVGSENVFMGNQSGYSNTSGVKNVFIGNHSGISNTSGHRNIMIGSAAGAFAETGTQNVFIGTSSGYLSRETWGNINIGYLSGYNTTTGSANTFVGARTGYSNTTGFSNTFIGIEAGYTIESNCCNTFLGDHAGYYAKTSDKNVFLGAYSGYNDNKLDTFSGSNVFIGNATGYNSVGGDANVFIGYQAGYSNSVSFSNVFMGFESGYSNTTGNDNVFIGVNSGHSNTTGRENVIIGWNAGRSNTTSLGNVFVGAGAGNKNTTGYSNTFMGLHAGENNLQAQENTIIGAWTADFYPLGNQNTLYGSQVSRLLKGSGNTIFGFNAGNSLENSNRNIMIGCEAGFHEKGSNRLFIDNQVSDSTNAFIYGQLDNRNLRFNTHVGINANPDPAYDLTVESDYSAADIKLYGTGNGASYATLVLESSTPENQNLWQVNHSMDQHMFKLVNLDGGGWHVNLALDTMGTLTLERGGLRTGGAILPLGNGTYSLGSASNRWNTVYATNGVINTSDARLKDGIQKLGYGLDELMKLNPISFHWKNSAETDRHVGLLAQEVQEVIKEVVKAGTGEQDALGINYSELIPVLIKAIQEQQVQIEQQNHWLTTQQAHIERMMRELEIVKALVNGK